jgi:hypothetical protein
LRRLGVDAKKETPEESHGEAVMAAIVITKLRILSSFVCLGLTIDYRPLCLGHQQKKAKFPNHNFFPTTTNAFI